MPAQTITQGGKVAKNQNQNNNNEKRHNSSVLSITRTGRA